MKPEASPAQRGNEQAIRMCVDSRHITPKHLTLNSEIQSKIRILINWAQCR